MSTKEAIEAAQRAFLDLPGNEHLREEMERGEAERRVRTAEQRRLAMAGDPAAAALVYLLPNHERGDEVARGYAARMPVAAFRVLLTDVWDHDDRELWAAADGDRRVICRWFRYAAFDLSHLPPRVTVWRGGVGDPGVVGWGMAWTTNRAVAAWFAHEHYPHRGRPAAPVVLRREVRRSQVLFASDARGEGEVVLARPGPFWIEEDAAELAALAEVHEAASRTDRIGAALLPGRDT